MDIDRWDKGSDLWTGWNLRTDGTWWLTELYGITDYEATGARRDFYLTTWKATGAQRDFYLTKWGNCRAQRDFTWECWYSEKLTWQCERMPVLRETLLEYKNGGLEWTNFHNRTDKNTSTDKVTRTDDLTELVGNNLVLDLSEQIWFEAWRTVETNGVSYWRTGCGKVKWELMTEKLLSI